MNSARATPNILRQKSQAAPQWVFVCYEEPGVCADDKGARCGYAVCKMKGDDTMKMLRQRQEHTASHSMRIVAGLLTVGALVLLAACSGAANNIGKAFGSAAAAACTPGREVDKTAYFTQVIQALQSPSVPVSDFAVNAFLAWEPFENTNACWNPLATTWGMPGSTSFNGAGVQNYPDQATGVTATSNTLNQTYNFYQPIRNMLARQGFDEAALTQALVKWVGSPAYADAVVAKWKVMYNQ